MIKTMLVNLSLSDFIIIAIITLASTESLISLKSGLAIQNFMAAVRDSVRILFASEMSDQAKQSAMIAQSTSLLRACSRIMLIIFAVGLIFMSPVPLHLVDAEYYFELLLSLQALVLMVAIGVLHFKLRHYIKHGT